MKTFTFEELEPVNCFTICAFKKALKPLINYQNSWISTSPLSIHKAYSKCDVGKEILSSTVSDVVILLNNTVRSVVPHPHWFYT